jgi:hypothetical protein
MMNVSRRFILTNYIFPIHEKVVLYDKFCFENPKNYTEIKLITRGLRQIIENGSGMLTTGSIITENDLLRRFKLFIESNSELTFKNSRYKIEIERLASNVVILSYDEPCIEETEENVSENIQRVKSQSIEKAFSDCIKILDLTIFASYENTLYPTKYDSIFLFDYFNPYNIRKESLIKAEPKDFFIFPGLYDDIKLGHPDYLKQRFDRILPLITKNLNSVLAKGNPKNIQFIRDSLYQIKEIENNQLSLILIVSLLEFLVTHKTNGKEGPSDSISSQLKRNLSTLAYLESNENDYKTIHEEIKLIYSLRSNIAHGNFDLMTESLGKLKNHYHTHNDFIKNSTDKQRFSGSDFILYHTFNRSKYYLRLVLRKYIDDPIFIEHIKQ